MTLTAYTRDNLLDVGREWLKACLTSAAADDGFAWFDEDLVIKEPAQGPGVVGPYFTVKELAFGVRDGLTGDRGSLGTINDFVHTDLTITAFGSEAYDALSWALWYWESGDGFDAQAALEAVGFQVVLDSQEVSPIPEFLETGFDIRGTATLRVGCLRTVERVTVNTHSIDVAGYVDDTLAVAATAVLED